MALHLADEGAWLALAARNAPRLEAVAEECRRRGGKALAIPTDVADEAQCKALVQRARETFGRIDMLVNNAGMDVLSKLEDLPDLDLFRQVMEVNFLGTVSLSYHALPALKETRGRIVNIASLGGLLAIPFNTSYIASKFAMMGFSDSLRMEVEPEGISVTTICPSLVTTEFHERYLDKDGRAVGPAGRMIYTPRTMTAEQCARVVLQAARRRKRQVVMRPGSVALWLKLIAPAWLDRLIMEKYLRPMVERTYGESPLTAKDEGRAQRLKEALHTIPSLIKGQHVCPWWLIHTFDNRLRRMFEDPEQVVAGLVGPGQTALDIGCGIGYFTLPLARLVGPQGLVIAADLQEKMLAGVQKRAERAGLISRIRLHTCRPETLGLNEPVDFILAHWMVHEVPDKERFLREVYALLKPGAAFLMVEPRGHVSRSAFDRTVALARQAGLTFVADPKVGLSRAALFTHS